MTGARILVVDDEEDIRELVRYNLERAGHEVALAASGEEALARVKRDPPDLLVLDLMLPGLDGLDVCRVLKNTPATAGLPIIMLTAKGEDADVVAGLELGADDYITKPFHPRVLVARVRAVLRRGRQPDESNDRPIRQGPLVLDIGRHEVRVEGAPVPLTATQFAILRLLASRPGWVFTRSQIINAVKGEDYPVTERSVDVQIVGLRKKLGPAGRLVQTVRGVGYRFEQPD